MKSVQFYIYDELYANLLQRALIEDKRTEEICLEGVIYFLKHAPPAQPPPRLPKTKRKRPISWPIDQELCKRVLQRKAQDKSGTSIIISDALTHYFGNLPKEQYVPKTPKNARPRYVYWHYNPVLYQKIELQAISTGTKKCDVVATALNYYLSS